MTNCWSEGALRAYLDRELPAEDMKSVAAHLGECSACDVLCAELAGRATRVFAMLEPISEPELAVKSLPAPPRTISRWLWPGAAVALAAGLAIASFVLDKRENTPPVVRTETPVLPEAPVQTVAPPVVTPLPAAPPVRARAASRKPRRDMSKDYFVALDDEPIESGVIMRMAIQPGNTQADIVFDPDGRARAIRLVSNKY
jgi:anti-sigma factor RsiW